MRVVLGIALLLLPGVAFAADGIVSANGPCRADYVVPYADQCTFGYHGIAKDRSPRNLQDAFLTCDRARAVSFACAKSATKQIHDIALGALYTAVSAQAEIAYFAGQYAIAESLFREKFDVLGALGREARRGDPGLAAARASTRSDIADSVAGQCTWKALALAGRQQALLRAHAYRDLAALLQTKAGAYQSCSRLAGSPQQTAYVQYLAAVALEEGGRAAQAAGDRGSAGRLYRSCIDDTVRYRPSAAYLVRGYLDTVNALCRGRLSGRYRVDQPTAIDADDGKHFKALALPKG
jgi:hypothetical protein